MSRDVSVHRRDVEREAAYSELSSMTFTFFFSRMELQDFAVDGFSGSKVDCNLT